MVSDNDFIKACSYTLTSVPRAVKVINADAPLTSIDAMSNGIDIAVGSTRGTIYHYDLRMGSVPLKSLEAHKSSVQGIRFQLGDLKVCTVEN